MLCFRIFMVFLLIGLNNGVVLTANEGKLSSSSNGYHGYKIRTLKGNRIIFNLENLSLSRGSTLTIQDGRDGVPYIYRQFGDGVFRSPENQMNLHIPVSFPMKIESQTRKLMVSYEALGPGNSFSASYTTYTNVGCKKTNLESTYQNIEDIRCDTNKYSPVAKICYVTLHCGDIYQQYNTTMVCRSNGEWDGKIECQPQRERIDTCSYNFDTLTDLSDCPYSTAEVVQYYMEVENVQGFTTDMGRSSGRSVNCKAICSHNGQGRRTFNCKRARKYTALYFRCLICRKLKGCGKNIAIF